MPKPATLIGFAAAAAFVAIVGYGYMVAFDTSPRGPQPDDAKVVAQGKTIYDANCASCHGKNLEGQPNWRVRNADGTFPAPPHDETGHTWHHPDAQLFAVIRDGGAAGAPAGFKSAMPAFGGKLSDTDIWAALSYIESRWPGPIRDRHKAMSRHMS